MNSIKNNKIQKFFIFLKNKIEHRHAKDKNYLNLRDHCHYTGKHGGAAHCIYNSKYSYLKKV